MTRYAIPRSWADLNIDKIDLQLAYEEDSHNRPENLEQWCNKCEKLVDSALKRTHQKSPRHQPVPCLPKSYRGRGFTNTPKKFPAQAQVKKGKQVTMNQKERLHQLKLKGK